MSQRVAIVLWSVLWFLCTGAPTLAQPAPAPGGITLLAGYQHERLQGTDTAVGRIWKKDGLVIEYDIGDLAGNYAQSHAKDKLEWFKEQTVGGRKVQLCLTKERVLYITVAGTANFYGSVKSEEALADMLLMVMTYGEKAKR